MARYLIQTFGCQMNVHDSRRIEEVLCARGYEPTDAPELADLVVFNTCSVRDKAEQKLRSAVGTFQPLKRRRRDMVIALVGCMAQQHGEALLKRIPHVDAVVGPDNIGELPELVREVRAGGPPVARTVFDLQEPTFLRAHVRPDTPEVGAYVTVMKGCDERCTFCIVPYTRGPERYRSGDDIVAEVAQLVRGGVREVTLLGQTVNSWHDRREPGAAGPSQFAALLERIAREVPELARLRYTSPHPRHVTGALVRAHAELDVLPRHVHLPVQSGSDRVLKRMLRRYRRAQYLEAVRQLQGARPGLTLSTDIIVGFPGETEQDFEATLSLIEEAGFVSLFAFKYSPRPRTPALKLDDDVPQAVKEERLARVLDLIDRQQRAHLQSLVGTRTRVLFEGPDRKVPGRFSGRSERNEVVHVDVPEGTDPTGQIVDVTVRRAYRHSLQGELSGGVRATATRPSRLRLPLLAP